MTLAELVFKFKLKCTKQHLSRLLKAKGIRTRVAETIFLMTKQNKKDRVLFPEYHLENDTDWSDYLFSDEVQIQCNTNGKVLVKRRVHEKIVQSK